jgi:Cu2+-exporting ATPase
VFQGERLAPVTEAIATAKRARFMAMQNFTVAAIYNALCVPLAMAGLVTPLIAAIVMSTSSILVTLNAARLAGRREA